LKLPANLVKVEIVDYDTKRYFVSKNS